MPLLSSHEQQTLIDMLVEQHGGALTCPQFAELMLSLFEDISGLEHLSPPDAAQLCYQLWRAYREQEKRQYRDDNRYVR